MPDLSFKDLCHEWTKILARRTPMPGHLVLSGCEFVQIMAFPVKTGFYYTVLVYKRMGRYSGLVPYELG